MAKKSSAKAAKKVAKKASKKVSVKSVQKRIKARKAKIAKHQGKLKKLAKLLKKKK